jgi:hypothetical protein
VEIKEIPTETANRRIDGARSWSIFTNNIIYLKDLPHRLGGFTEAPQAAGAFLASYH